MRIFCWIVTFVVSGLCVTGCNYKTPSVDVAKFDFSIPESEIMKGLRTCSKAESEQVFSEESLRTVVTVVDEIESKDIEYLDCDHKGSSKGHGPVRSVQKSIQILPPHLAASEVSFISVQVGRTCSTSRLDSIEGRDVVENGERREAQSQGDAFDRLFTRVERSGAIRLSVTDDKFKLYGMANVTDGRNVVDIQYFGRCKEYRSDRDPKLGEAYNCLQAEVLGEKHMVIELKIHRPEVSGVRQVDTCFKGNPN